MQRIFLFLVGAGVIATVTYSMWMFLAGGSLPSLQLSLPWQQPSTGQFTRYAALGDSYTVGEGVAARDAWPAQLVEMAGERGVPLKLVATIARSGWTTVDLIDKGLDQLDATQPEFVTIMIGTNDAQQNISPAQFQTNMRIILDKVGAVVPPEKTVLVTIPDYLVTPTGAVKATGQDPAGEVRNLNTILRNEAAERGIAVADLYEVSRQLGTNPTLIHRDGLHPSAAGHHEWAITVLPTVLAVFGK